jgi:hypothetical protein
MVPSRRLEPRKGLGLGAILLEVPGMGLWESLLFGLGAGILFAWVYHLGYEHGQGNASGPSGPGLKSLVSVVAIVTAIVLLLAYTTRLHQ